MQRGRLGSQQKPVQAFYRPFPSSSGTSSRFLDAPDGEMTNKHMGKTRGGSCFVQQTTNTTETQSPQPATTTCIKSQRDSHQHLTPRYLPCRLGCDQTCASWPAHLDRPRARWSPSQWGCLAGEENRELLAQHLNGVGLRITMLLAAKRGGKPWVLGGPACCKGQGL